MEILELNPNARVCAHCKQPTHDGVSNLCKPCRAAYAKARRLDGRDKSYKERGAVLLATKKQMYQDGRSCGCTFKPNRDAHYKAFHIMGEKLVCSNCKAIAAKPKKTKNMRDANDPLVQQFLAKWRDGKE